MVQRLKELMETKGLTFKALSKLSGISDTAILGYCKGKSEPTLSKVEKLAEALDVTPAHLVGWAEMPGQKWIKPEFKTVITEIEVEKIVEIQKEVPVSVQTAHLYQPTAFAPEHRPNREGKVIKWVNTRRPKLRERRDFINEKR